MNSQRLHLLLVVCIIMLFIGLAAGTYGINQLLATESSKLTALKAKDLALTREQLNLRKAKNDIQKYTELEKIARAVVPEDKNQAEAVREIVKIAAANNVKLASISFPASTLGNTPTSSTTTNKPAANTSTPAAASTKTLSQLEPVKNILGVYQLPITVNGDSNQPVQYDKFISFLTDLEHNRRTAQVSSITLEPNTLNPNYLTFSLILNEYIKP